MNRLEGGKLILKSMKPIQTAGMKPHPKQKERGFERILRILRDESGECYPEIHVYFEMKRIGDCLAYVIFAFGLIAAGTAFCFRGELFVEYGLEGRGLPTPMSQSCSQIFADLLIGIPPTEPPPPEIRLFAFS